VAASGSLSIGLSWTAPADGGTDTAFLDADPELMGGQTYWYVVFAVNAIGTSEASNTASEVISP
jgi:hypothetical protein